MELFERIRFILKKKKVSQAALGNHLGFSPQNFSTCFSLEAEHRFWKHLPKILELFPDVRREWLYMGEEPAFRDGACAEPGPTKESIAALEAENARLRRDLDEERALNRKLTARLLVEGSGDKGEQTNIGKASAGHG